jgi:hypothetical protein
VIWCEKPGYCPWREYYIPWRKVWYPLLEGASRLIHKYEAEKLAFLLAVQDFASCDIGIMEYDEAVKWEKEVLGHDPPDPEP